MTSETAAFSARVDLDSSAFSPRLNPRPKYPPFLIIALKAVRLYWHDIFLGCLLLVCLWRPYQTLRQILGWSDRAFYTLTLAGVHSFAWVLFNGSILALERVGWLEGYRIGRSEAEIPSTDQVKQLYAATALNHLVTTPLTAYFIYPLVHWLGTPLASAPLKNLALQALLFAGAHLGNDVGFYWTHRLLHSKAMYKRFHKKHHTFKGTVGAAAEFAHPVEVVLSNQLPTIGCMVAFGTHPLFQAVWLLLRLLQTYEVHSGYAFQSSLLGRCGLLVGDASFHDHHHTVNMGNFGAEHMDWLFGTMDHYARDGREAGYLQKRGFGFAGGAAGKAAPAAAAAAAAAQPSAPAAVKKGQ